MKRRNYKVCAFFDTETTTLGEGLHSVAFPVLYIFNDIRDVEISEYRHGVDDFIRMYRQGSGALAFIDNLVAWGRSCKVVPIIGAYNLGFDLQSLLFDLSKKYGMSVLAQSSVSYYTLDLLINGEPVLRFWDLFYLDMGGVASLGRTCGIGKLSGAWDYSKVRTTETPIDFDEICYAARDVEVLPAFLEWLLRANAHVKPSDLGVRLLTKTSLVRLLGTRTVGRLKTSTNSNSNVLQNFKLLCKQENAPDFETYALRKNCFRGGLTFTCGKFSSQIFENVAGFDVVSMHHTFINGREVPVKFARVSSDVGDFVVSQIIGTSLDTILEKYERPFEYAINARIVFSNIRIRKNSIFERLGLAILPASKFHKTSEKFSENSVVDASRPLLENNAKAIKGDSAKGAKYAFGKLYSADYAIVNLTELELWAVAQVYEFDSIEFLDGETTRSFVKPPEYVTLLSNMLFEQKTAMKNVLADYDEGSPYRGKANVNLLPSGIRSLILAGDAEKNFLETYYNSTVKGSFNSIYGTMSQDIYKPDWRVTDGELEQLQETLPSADNFNERTPKNIKVLYTFGARIVGGSRLHLLIAIILIWRRLGERAIVLGGDTDSLKVTLRYGTTPDDILEALEPLHSATLSGMNRAQENIRKRYPRYASTLDKIGFFEYEGKTYAKHIELWNKARVSYDGDNFHVTMAGVPRPPHAMNIEKALNRLADVRGVDFAMLHGVGYNLELSPRVSNFLGVARPHVKDRFRGVVKDWLGDSCHVDSRRAIALYPAAKMAGDTSIPLNRDNVDFLVSEGVEVDTLEKRYRYDGTRLFFTHGNSEQEI